MRKTGVELLRIISMLMIICLHYLSKGGALVRPADSMTINGYIAWLVEAFCLVAVNVYVLISGYFATEKSATVQKTIKIWIQVFFYNLVIGMIAIILGAQTIDLYAIIDLLFPVITEQYWFATSFILLSLLAPFMQKGAVTMDKKSFGYSILFLLIFDSISKTILPMQLPWDKAGYDVIWFLCVYLTGMYLKRYGIPNLLQKRASALGIYVSCQILTFFSMLVIRTIYLRTGKFETFITYGYSYNHLFCYLGAIGLFLFFVQSKEHYGKAASLIQKISGATFGVYLIHEHKNVRYAWTKWMACGEAYTKNPAFFLLHMIGSVVLVYIVCTAIEMLRQTLFLLCRREK